MRFLLALLLSLALGSAPAFADSFVSLSPLAPVSMGTTTSALGGVTGACVALKNVVTSTLLLTVDCSGNVGVASVAGGGLTPGGCVQAGTNGVLTTPSATACGAGGGSTKYRIPIPSFGFGNVQYYIPSPVFNASEVGTSTIKTIEVFCEPYTTETITNTYSSATITGGVMSFWGMAVRSSTPVALGTVTLAGTTTGIGNDVTVTLGTPYTPAANSGISAQVTTVTSGSNPWSNCSAYVGT